MADKDAGTPRVFIYRHGETEWTKNGRYTGTTDLPLTAAGETQVLASGKLVVSACLAQGWPFGPVLDQGNDAARGL